MNQTTIIEENQKLRNDIEFLERKYRESKKENLILRKESTDLKKNLEGF